MVQQTLPRWLLATITLVCAGILTSQLQAYFDAEYRLLALQQQQLQEQRLYRAAIAARQLAQASARANAVPASIWQSVTYDWNQVLADIEMHVKPPWWVVSLDHTQHAAMSVLVLEHAGPNLPTAEDLRFPLEWQVISISRDTPGKTPDAHSKTRVILHVRHSNTLSNHYFP
jgi:hypothetical protein